MSRRSYATRFLGPVLLVLFWAGAFRLPAPANPPQVGSASQAQDLERALRTRVLEFYTLLQTARWTQAEEYLTEDSKAPELFHTLIAKPFLASELRSVKIDPDGVNGTAVMQLQFFVPYSNSPLKDDRISHWRLIKGVWYLELPKPDLKAPFPPSPDKTPPPPQDLKFKGNRYNLGDLKPGEVKAATLHFTNASNHVVKITDVLTGCECLRPKTGKKEYLPGESGELVIEFDSTGYDNIPYAETIRVITDPGGLTTYLDIFARVLPSPPPPEEKDAAKKPGGA